MKLNARDLSFFVAMVTSQKGRTWLKSMINENKNVCFSRNLYSYQAFELRFEIRDPKLTPMQKVSLIHKKRQRFFTFLVVATGQNDDEVITLK